MKAATGDHRTGAQVVTVVFVGVFAGLIKGKNTQIPKGTMITAYSDQDTVLVGPVAAPPGGDVRDWVSRRPIPAPPLRRGGVIVIAGSSDAFDQIAKQTP